MKIRITMKDPDGAYGSIDAAVRKEVERMAPSFDTLDDPDAAIDAVSETVREQVLNATGPWLRYGEYVTIEIDSADGTARVVRDGE